MDRIPFKRELSFEYGQAAQLSPLIRRVVAKNPSMFTLHGTGTYIVGKGNVAIIDPGPNIPEHIAAVLETVRGETVTDIVITHTHIDHSPATPHVKAATKQQLGDLDRMEPHTQVNKWRKARITILCQTGN